MRYRWVSTLRESRRRAWAVVVLIVVCVALLLYALPRRPVPAPPAATPPLPAAPAPPPPLAWLGLNYNSDPDTGGLRAFAVRGIVYDRLGSMEIRAGTTPQNSSSFGSGLATAYGAGMVPDIEVDLANGPPGCHTDPVPTKFCLPTNPKEVESYVQGFITTATSVLRHYPHHQALFEPTDEPWSWAFPPGTPSGKPAAREYALLLSQLLRAAGAAGMPLSDVYVPATGRLDDGTSWIPDLYRAQPCLKPGPSSCGPIAGWNLHPYGLPNSSTEGIDLVPRVRSEMLSGQDNIIVSEIGFCAIDVNNGNECGENLPDIVGTSRQTADWLQETLNEAARMHRAGWLKALLVWERSGRTGWTMQNANGTLTAQGRTLDLFADSPAGR